jgi:hypothetical protein
LKELCFIAGLALAALGLRSFANVWLRRMGSVMILLASYRLGATLFGGAWGGGLAAALWLLVPVIHVLVGARRASFPLEKQLRYRRPPSAEDFPELAPLTAEFEAAGFVMADDIGWDWESNQQFTRWFIHEEMKLEGAIHLHTQETMLFSFISLTSRTEPDQRWISWNSPFQMGLEWPPGVALNPQPGVFSHEDFHAVKFPTAQVLAPEPGALLRQTQEEGRRQVDYNLNRGLLQLMGDGRFTYSWKGCWFMVRQLMIERICE